MPGWIAHTVPQSFLIILVVHEMFVPLPLLFTIAIIIIYTFDMYMTSGHCVSSF
jgi:hypothetical protein